MLATTYTILTPEQVSLPVAITREICGAGFFWWHRRLTGAGAG
jgi:hypothetical protein